MKWLISLQHWIPDNLAGTFWLVLMGVRERIHVGLTGQGTRSFQLRVLLWNVLVNGKNPAICPVKSPFTFFLHTIYTNYIYST
jgi:hypothetical protein